VLERLGIEPKRTTGRELWAPCPLHARNGRPERTPSFRVHDEPGDERHGFFQCFGSCEGDRRNGGILKLIRLILDLETNADARRWLRDETVEREPDPAPERVRIESTTPDPRRGGVEIPAGAVFAPVARWPGPARDYLLARGVPAEQAERWGLGYAAIGRYAGRLIIPAHDGAGRLVNFTARSFVGNPRKFKEPPEGSGANKGAIFGERFWPIPKERRVVMAVESALNALAVERAIGQISVAAIFGSEVLPMHLLRLGTFPTVLVASDPDKAGEKYWRAIRSGLARHAKTERVAIPDGTDCADLGRDDPSILRRTIEEAATRAGIDLAQTISER
jgi:DNA primase